MELKSDVGLNKALEDIKTGKVFPVYLIYGDDNYVIREATQEIIHAILPERERSTGLEMIDGENEDWNRIFESLNTFPLFGSQSVIAIKDSKIFYSRLSIEKVVQRSMEQFEKKDINEAIKHFRTILGLLKVKDVSELRDKKWVELQEFIGDRRSQRWLNRMVEECLAQGLSPTILQDNSDKLNDLLRRGERDKEVFPRNILILSTEEVDKRKRLYKTISDLGVIVDLSIQKTRRDPQEVEEDEKRTLLQKATELLKRSDKVFGKGAFDTLANKTGYNMGVFVNELEKVILSVKDNKIETHHIEEIVGRTKEDSVFDLQNALGQKDLERAMFYLKDLLGQDEPPLKILNGIANEVRHLIMAKEFLEKELKSKWSRQMDAGKFKSFIYFPIILKKKRENQERGRSSIYRLPPDVLLELFKSSENFTYRELSLFMKLLAEIDVKMKSVKVAPSQLLEKALIEICGKGSEGRACT